MNGFDKATPTMISSFEQHFDCSLPEDYKRFLQEYNGGFPKEKYSTFNVEELNEDIPLDVLLGIGVRKFDLQKRNDEYIEDLLPNTIIIGDDPGSNMIVLINDIKMKGVYYWDHSHNFDQSSEEKDIFKIADSFQNFIDGLKNPF